MTTPTKPTKEATTPLPVRMMPLQRDQNSRMERERATCCEAVYMAAYKVYSRVYQPQPAMIEGGCRGGFSIGELIAFLYARSFPEDQWSARVDEAFTGLRT